ncbi:MAG: TIGR03936 family radical SAM-associated protein [Roseburia sp.]|nr:TIGR03936 family radical SAM-associated protein [Roseburia sp.]
MKIRIKFAKYGTMKFIGHLDMMRFFQKAIRRADIDVRYTEGFSPHQVMSFAAPLGVGLESAGEYLDIEVNSLLSTHKMKDALNGVMVEGLRILSVKALPDNVKNAMASVAAARYHVRAAGHSLAIENISGKLSAFYAQEQIPVIKQTKKSTLELDLKPAIYELDIKEVSSPFYPQPGAYPVISMLVNASSSGNIKPVMVLEALCSYCGMEYTPQAYQITRMETYTTGEEAPFIPLEAVGSDYPGGSHHADA